MLVSCSTPKAPLNYSENWKSSKFSKNSETKNQIWDYLQEKKITISKPLNLIELIDIALFNSPSTHLAWEATRVKEAEIYQAKSKFYPQLTISASAQREKAEANQPTADINDFKYGPASQITYLLLDFGGRKADVEEASLRLLAANFQFNQSIQDLLLEVEKSYYVLYSNQSELKAARINLKETRLLLNAAQQKFQAGLVSKLNILEAQYNYDNSAYNFQKASSNIKIAKANLAQVLGFPPNINLEVTTPLREIPTDISSQDIHQLIKTSLTSKPNIMSLKKTLQAQKEAVKAASSDLWPEITIGGSAAKNWYKYYNLQKEYNNDSEYAGYLNVTWNIFDGFYNLNKKQAQEATLEAEYQKLSQAELTASLNIWTNYYAFKTARKEYTSAKASFNNAKAIYNSISENYQAGLKDILDLIKTKSQLSEASSNLIQSENNLFISLANLAHATGSITKRKKELSTTLLNY